MKKITIVVAVAALAALLALGVAGCGKKDDSTVQSSPDLLGAWSLNAAFDVTPEAQALMDKALEGWTGATYVPVAYIATQPVSGTNHLFVCRETMVVPDAQETWALVTLYEQLDGTVTISDVQNSGV